MSKFKRGDTVIGNEKADDYGITRKGWVGVVIEASTVSGSFRAKAMSNGQEYSGLLEGRFDLHIEDTEKLEKVEENPRKKKILYPVGTIVEVRPGFDALGPAGPRRVQCYIKGDERPYKISSTNRFNSASRTKSFAVNELQLYKAVDSHPQETVETPVKSISTDEVEKLIKEARQRLREEMQAEAAHEMKQMTERLIEAQKAALCPPMIICNQSHNKSIAEKAEKKSTMSTIREKIRYATLSADEKVLRETGILSENGNITEQGRRVVLDILFEDKDLRSQVVSLVKKTLPKESK